MRSLDTRLVRLEHATLLHCGYQFLAVAESPDEAARIRSEADARGVTIGLFIHTYLRPEKTP